MKHSQSPYGLLQEELEADPWKIFVCCIFCNLTKRRTAEPYFWEVINKYKTPERLAKCNVEELAKIIGSLGLSKRRANALVRMSADYTTKNWQKDPKVLYGIGKYGSDAYYLFCSNEWKKIEPTDYALKLYKKWLIEKSSCTFHKKNL